MTIQGLVTAHVIQTQLTIFFELKLTQLIDLEIFRILTIPMMQNLYKFINPTDMIVSNQTTNKRRQLVVKSTIDNRLEL